MGVVHTYHCTSVFFFCFVFFFDVTQGAPKPSDQQTNATIPGLPQTPLSPPSAPALTPQAQLPGLTAPAMEAAQTTQFSQTQGQGQTPLLPGLAQQMTLPSPPSPPVSPFASNQETGQKPLMPMGGSQIDNGAGSYELNHFSSYACCKNGLFLP